MPSIKNWQLKPMRVEGIVIHKTPYKERDLICNLLLRSGKKISVYVYGGQGGGKSQKGSLIELGFMLGFELNTRKKKMESELKVVKEYSLIWRADKIRENFQAFYLMTFFLEYMAKISIDEDLEYQVGKEHEGLFNVLSNSIFHLDHAVKNKQFDQKRHLFLFLAKLASRIGVLPELETCLFCASDLDKSMCIFDLKDGGFICHDCYSQRDEFLSEDKALLEEFQSSKLLREKLKLSLTLPYEKYLILHDITPGQNLGLFNYINYQFSIDNKDVRTWGVVSS